MEISVFNKLVDYIVDEKVRKVMCAKSAEYARGGDKLHNFKRAAKVDGISSVEALRGMMLKHSVSIKDMLDDLMQDIHHPKKLWDEKIIDNLNYLILLYALLSETEKWDSSYE